MEIYRPALLLGALYGGTAVALGAVGSHVLASSIRDEELVNAWDVGVRYQAWHALALLALAALGPKLASGAATWGFGLGVLLFSGSLYGLALGWLSGALGLITPIGGLILTAGWIALFVRALQLPAGRS
ncbi:MAG: DUF423 domain-containing protein [Planctomycetaceae bacterium]|nr:DUF423 domain-containing protein [Planctomycetaceae bacterium]